MNSAGLIAWLTLVLGAAAHAEETDLSSRSHASAAKAAEPIPSVAPFAGRPDPLQSFSMRSPGLTLERAVPCADGLTSVCYDMRDRGVVYRGAREYMPRLQGLTPDGVALRHDRVILRYTFR
jgi:hypothetical protein